MEMEPINHVILDSILIRIADDVRVMHRVEVGEHPDSLEWPGRRIDAGLLRGLEAEPGISCS